MYSNMFCAAKRRFHVIYHFVAIGRIRSQGPAVASGVMLTAGFALGAFLQSVAPLAIDVESFLVGQVLAVTGADIALTAVLLAAAMMLDHVKLGDRAARLRKAIDDTLNIDRVRTGDLKGTADTEAYTRALVARIANG